jgi:hypothetical protein
MSFDYKCLVTTWDGNTPVLDIIKNSNNPALPGGIYDKLVAEFDLLNKSTIGSNAEILIPVLPPFVKKHDPAKIIERPEIKIEKEPEPTPAEEHTTGKLNYRTYPYTFSRPNETIEAIIRLYNDMSVSRTVISKLAKEFTEINREALPPKLGQSVQIPVLLPFCFRHENEHKIFNDGK